MNEHTMNNYGELHKIAREIEDEARRTKTVHCAACDRDVSGVSDLEHNIGANVVVGMTSPEQVDLFVLACYVQRNSMLMQLRESEARVGRRV
jgi:hypothetical protein